MQLKINRSTVLIKTHDCTEPKNSSRTYRHRDFQCTLKHKHYKHLKTYFQTFTAKR